MVEPGPFYMLELSNEFTRHRGIPPVQLGPYSLESAAGENHSALENLANDIESGMYGMPLPLAGLTVEIVLVRAHRNAIFAVHELAQSISNWRKLA